KIYRAVSMPHIGSFPNGRWWFAQNLDYRKNMIMNKDAATNGNAGYYWCPGALSFDGKPYPVANNATAVSGGDTACDAYGALYAYNTVMSRNGLAPVLDDTAHIQYYSLSQGICPKGWVVPARFDWGVMLNKVVGCDDNQAVAPVDNTSTAVPCYNYPSEKVAAGATYALPNTAVSSGLRSTLSSRLTKADSSFSSKMSPLWSWWGVGAKKVHGARATDHYGFSLLPAGGILADKKFSQVGTASEFALASNERLQLHYANQNTYASSATGASVRCVHNPELDGKIGGKHMITIKANRTNAVSISPSGEKDDSRLTTVSTSATHDMLVFDGWYEGEKLVHSDKDYTFTVIGSRTLEARYDIAGTTTPNFTIPDENFRNYIRNSLNIKVDETYTDAGVTYYRPLTDAIKTQMAAVREIRIVYSTISPETMKVSNTEGLQYFTGLTELRIAGSSSSYLHAFTSIDLSKNTNLQTLQVFNNTALTALDLSKNTAL
ncbi:MAG: FISUMP domain-containing protein, partial [Bacteroidales bacterium]